MPEQEFNTEERVEDISVEQIKLFRIPSEGYLETFAQEVNAYALKIRAEHGNPPAIHHSGNYVSVICVQTCKHKKIVKTPKIGQ